MNRKVRIKKDITHREFTVLGILWDSEYIILADCSPVHHSELDLVPEENNEDDEEHGWYPI